MKYTFPSMLVTTTSIHLHAVFPVLPGCAVRQGRAQNASQSAEKCRYSLAYPIWPFATWQWYLEKTALLCSWFLRWYLRNRWFNPHRGKIWHNREEGGGRNEAGKFQRYEIQLPEEENEAGRISGGHGGDHPVGGMGGNHQALVSLWETRTAAHRDRNYAADVSAAMLVQPVGRGRRGGHLRQQRRQCPWRHRGGKTAARGRWGRLWGQCISGTGKTGWNQAWPTAFRHQIPDQLPPGLGFLRPLGQNRRKKRAVSSWFKPFLWRLRSISTVYAFMMGFNQRFPRIPYFWRFVNGLVCRDQSDSI